jgi:putative sterol carrier protein
MDATTEFFSALGQRGHEPLLKKVTGTLRFDLVQGEGIDHRFVTIKKGDVAISEENTEADCVVRTDRSLFDCMVNGEQNAMAAALRGALVFRGNAALLLSFQRLFSGPVNSLDQGRPTSGGGNHERRPRQDPR